MSSGTPARSQTLSRYSRRTRDRIAAIVKETEVCGPNMAEVARRLKEPKESISYAFRSAIERRGYVVQARMDTGALGLRDAVVLVEAAEGYGETIGDIFDGMDDRWYLMGFSRTLPDGRYVLHFSLPEDSYSKLPRLLKSMKRAGVIARVDRTMRFSWRRHVPMRAELFDFKRGRWEFDWASLPSTAPIKVSPRAPAQKIDSTDIAILASMITNATTPLKTMAKHLRVSGKTAYRHAEHIAQRGLVAGYGVNWLRSHMNTDLGRPYAPRHKLAFTYVCVHSVTPKEQEELSERLNALPFIWFEAGGDDYLAELGIPLEQTVETMSYLREVLKPVAKKSETFMTDPTCSRGYSPPSRLVDDVKGGWIFDLDAQAELFEEQTRIVKKENRTIRPPSA